MASYGVGATLREERLRRQLTLGEIARQTKISERFLKAIESEDFGILPGVVFTRNFVRQYAALVEMDPSPLLAALPSFDLETAPLPSPPQRSRQSSWDPRWNSAFASIAWTVLAAGAAVAAYVHFNRHVHPQEIQAAVVSKAPAEKTTPVPQPTPASAEAAPAETQAPVDPAVSPKESSTATPAPVPDPDSPVRVVIAAREDSWVQVTAGGKTAFIGTLKANDSKSFSSDGPVRVRTGNAGGIDISLNGKTLESLGPSGQIRSVSLTAEGPQFAPKTPPVSPDPI